MPPKFANAFFLDKDDAQIVLIRTWIEKGPPPLRRWDKSVRGRAVSFSTRDDTSISHFLINRFKPVLTGTGGDKCETSQKSFILLFVPHQCAVPAELASLWELTLLLAGTLSSYFLLKHVGGRELSPVRGLGKDEYLSIGNSSQDFATSADCCWVFSSFCLIPAFWVKAVSGFSFNILSCFSSQMCLFSWGYCAMPPVLSPA